MSSDAISRDAAIICERAGLNSLSGKTILVTGASGLIGTYFIATLAHLRQGGVDINCFAQVRHEPPVHTVGIVARGGFQLVRADLADHAGCGAMPCADIIIHCAGYAQPALFMASGIATYQLNTAATISLLQRLKPGGVFLFLSSTELYNGITGRAATEDDIGTTNPCHPRACYIEGKRGGEAICHAFCSQGVRAVCARLAMTYGPGTQKGDTRALNSFIERAICQRQIVLMDAGRAVRTYCYISDAVELMWQAVLHGTQPVYNVGGHSTVTIAGLAELIGLIVGVPVAFPAQATGVAGAPEEVRLDVTRTEAEFGKTGYVSLEDGLRATIAWQRQLYKRT